MCTINVLARVLTVWFCLNKGLSLPEYDKVNTLDQNALLKTSNPSDLTEERIGGQKTRRRVKFTKRITQRRTIFSHQLDEYDKREGLV